MGDALLLADGLRHTRPAIMTPLVVVTTQTVAREVQHFQSVVPLQPDRKRAGAQADLVPFQTQVRESAVVTDHLWAEARHGRPVTGAG